MFSSNQLFEVTGDDEKVLRAVLGTAIAIGGGIRSYRMASGGILVFGRYADCYAYINYPMEVNPDIATKLALAHLQSTEASVQYQNMERLDGLMDGMCREGWRVFYPGWKGFNGGYNDIDNNASPDEHALVAVAPFWTFYHI